MIFNCYSFGRVTLAKTAHSEVVQGLRGSDDSSVGGVLAMKPKFSPPEPMGNCCTSVIQAQERHWSCWPGSLAESLSSG